MPASTPEATRLPPDRLGWFRMLQHFDTYKSPIFARTMRLLRTARDTPQGI
jgi:hypothetical protein